MALDTQTDEESKDYEVKTVRIRHGATAMSMMMVKFDGRRKEPFADEGYGGEYIIFTAFTGGEMVSSYDPYKLKRQVQFDLLFDFAVALEKSSGGGELANIHWSDVEDGEEIDPGRFEELDNS